MSLLLNLVEYGSDRRSYQSHYGMYPHFGFGARTRIDRIEVRWIGGDTDVLEGVEVDRILTIAEGRGKGGRSLSLEHGLNE